MGVAGGGKSVQMRPGGSAGAGTVTLGVSGGLLRSVLIADDMLSHSS